MVTELKGLGSTQMAHLVGNLPRHTPMARLTVLCHVLTVDDNVVP